MKKFIKNKINKIKKRWNEISFKKYICTNWLFITFVAVNLASSWVLRIVTMGSWFSFKAIISDLAFICLIGAFGYLTKPKKQIRLFLTFTIVMSLISIINAVYYENYISFASFSLLSTASFLGQMDGGVITSLIKVKDLILILFPFILIGVHFYLKKRNYYPKVALIERSRKRFTNTIIIGVFFTFLTILLMESSDYSRLQKQWNREYLVQRFGIYVYQTNDLINSTQSKFTSLFGYDSAYKTVREFYDNRKIDTKENKYTDIFEGKNIIVLHYESMMNHNMTLSFNGKELTPNLNKIASEGLFFNNFYSQVSVGNSSDSEFTFNTSLLPASTGTVFVNYWDRTYEAIPNILKEKGYYSASMHANNASFWNRNNMHQTLGYDKFYAKDTYDVTEENIIGMGLSDEEFLSQSVDKIKKISTEHDKYYVTLITLTNHTPWEDEDKYGDYEVNYKKTITKNGKTEEVVMPYLEGSEIGRYYKSVNYADKALGLFVEKLEKEGLLEDSVLVIYGDHDAKLSKKNYRLLYNYDFETGELKDKDDPTYNEVDYYSYELNRKVPFIIWTKDSKNNKLLNKEIDTAMGMMDVLPTLANMFNFEYKYALGHDIFNVKDNLVVFPNGNWLTNNLYYNSQKDEYMPINNSVVNPSLIEENKVYADSLLDVSNSIVVFDLEAKNNEN